MIWLFNCFLSIYSITIYTLQYILVIVNCQPKINLCFTTRILKKNILSSLSTLINSSIIACTHWTDGNGIDLRGEFVELVLAGDPLELLVKGPADLELWRDQAPVTDEGATSLPPPFAVLCRIYLSGWLFGRKCKVVWISVLSIGDPGNPKDPQRGFCKFEAIKTEAKIESPPWVSLEFDFWAKRS